MAASDVIDKWGAEVAGRGFTQIPNYLLILNQFLSEEKRLAPAEHNILLQLVGAWWKKGELPFPSLKTLAVRSGISDRQAQRAVSRLEAGGFLKRTKRKGAGGLIASNAYDLSPLVSFLGVVAKAFPNEYARKMNKEEIAKLEASLADLTVKTETAGPSE